MIERFLRARKAVAEISLRPAVAQDADLLHGWRREVSVRRYQPLAELSALQLRAELAEQRISDLYRSRGDKFQWLILADKQPAGWITLVVNNWQHGLAEIGYALGTDFQGRGLMLRALPVLLRELFAKSRLERIEARCAVNHRASQRVLERLGFHREGRLRGYFVLGTERVDNYLYSLIREDVERSSS